MDSYELKYNINYLTICGIQKIALSTQLNKEFMEN